MKLPNWLKDIEHLVDRIIPFLLVILAGLIIFEFTPYAHNYEKIIFWMDSFIVAFFIIDLSFKWFRVKKTVTFFKLYWIDIVAVFPFYIVFRLYALAAEAAAAGETAQKFLHEAALVREVKFAKESKLVAKLAKEGRLVRAAARFLRLLRLRWYVAHGHMQSVSLHHAKHNKR